jgi:hypothetical protein
MRLRIASLRRVCKSDLPVEFVRQDLTSYGGLELLRRFFSRLGLYGRLRRAFDAAGMGGDYGGGRLVLLIVGLLAVGARRLEHLRYVASDPLLGRLCGLARIPSSRTVANWLKRFTQRTLTALVAVTRDLLYEQIEQLGLARLTIDVDGTVINTGSQVAWAFRGFNPNRRNTRSYYPLVAHLAQTGQILRLRNRPGNVHDSRGAVHFLRETIRELRGRFGSRVAIEFRMDAAFFQRKILRLLNLTGTDYAIKIGFFPWLNLKSLVAAQHRWTKISRELDCFETQLTIPSWNTTLRVVIYRQRVAHESAKNFQLDLFTPDDGHFEYSAVTTNKSLTPKNLWNFIAGRGEQEKTFAELKGELAFDAVPTNHYGANSAWQQISVLAHNLLRSFQLQTLAPSKPRSRKRTSRYLIRNARTLRFLLICRAGRICRIAGRSVLRLAQNPATQTLYEQITHALAA